MSFALARRPLRFLLLVSTLSSAPVGSMEQWAPQLIGESLLIPALRIDSTAATASQASPQRHCSSELPQPLGLLPRTGSLSPGQPVETHWGLSALGETGVASSTTDYLPYYAQPPPLQP